MGDEIAQIDLNKVLEFYSREDVQDAILFLAKDREVAVRFPNLSYGKRPDILQYRLDILELAKQGALTFDVSEERWRNPLHLAPGMRRTELDSLRQGWDLLLDIDSNNLEISKLAADLVIKALEYYDVPVTVKFSGRAGFHIAVPYESFPDAIEGKETRTLFPEAARIVAAYIADMIKDQLSAAILQKYKIEQLQELSGKKFEELVEQDKNEKKLNPFSLVDIDTILISSRHLFRSVYSINQKTGLVSIPVDKKKILQFNKGSAAMDKVEVDKIPFLDISNAESNQAKQLFVQAYDWAKQAKVKEEEQQELSKSEEVEVPAEAIDEKYFPPCIKHILEGLEDGRKRAMFILINFLVCCGWSYDQIEKRLLEWNECNKEPLSQTILLSQLRYSRQKNKKVLPPNCDNKTYLLDIRACNPDALCRRVKNPVNYVKIRLKQQLEIEKQQNSKRTLTEEKKQQIKETKEKQKLFREEMKKKRGSEKDQEENIKK
jgi:DNA primase large subunit